MNLFEASRPGQHPHAVTAPASGIRLADISAGADLQEYVFPVGKDCGTGVDAAAVPGAVGVLIEPYTHAAVIYDLILRPDYRLVDHPDIIDG